MRKDALCLESDALPLLLSTKLNSALQGAHSEFEVHRGASVSDIVSFPMGPFKVRVERSHFVPMRDGPRLSTDLYFPEDASGPLPVILERTPYDKKTHRNADPNAPVDRLNKAYYFASHGFVFAVQDQRGKFESEGHYVVLNNDVEDAADTFDWLVAQEWCSGRIGMIGISIPGAVQIKAAQTLHPALAAIVPQAAATGHGSAGGTMAKFWLRGGVQNLTIPLWTHFCGSNLFYRPSRQLSRDEFLQIADRFDGAPAVGAMSEAFNADLSVAQPYYDALMSLPIVDIDKVLKSPPSDWENLATRAPLDPWWDSGNYLEDDTKVDAPALHINAWHDYGVKETLLQFQHFRTKAESQRSRDNQFVIISPLSHGTAELVSERTITGERDVGDARFDFWGTYLRWFEYTLKGVSNEFSNETPRIQYYVPGLNKWKSSDVWPIRGTKITPLYLSGGGRANTRLGDGLLVWDAPATESEDIYVYDPANPVFELAKSVQVGSFDCSELELRDDILVYTSRPLKSPIEMTGQMRARLFVSADVPDTDIAVKILDVFPDGRAFALQEGFLRLRYREGFDKEVMMRLGEVVEADIDMLMYSNYFLAGHAIRIEITSSNMPNYARNLNTGGDNARDTRWQKATVRIHHGQGYPSRIELPLIEHADHA